MKKNNYLLTKNKINDEINFLKSEEEVKYVVKPKKQIKNKIKVDRIIFISPSFTEKVLKKKIDIKIESFLEMLDDIDEENDDESKIQTSLFEIEKFKLLLIAKYRKHLPREFLMLTLRKLQIIINEMKVKLYFTRQINNYFEYEKDKKTR